MKISILFIFIAFIATTFACKQNETKSQETELKVEAPTSGEAVYPGIPNDLFQNLIDSTDYIDYVFYEFEFSISINKPMGIKHTLAQVSGTPALIKPACKPIGRIFYQIKGRNAAEADLYFSNGCTYLLFMKDNKPVYANQLSTAGIDFLNNQFKNLMKDFKIVK